ARHRRRATASGSRGCLLKRLSAITVSTVMLKETKSDWFSRMYAGALFDRFSHRPPEIHFQFKPSVTHAVLKRHSVGSIGEVRCKVFKLDVPTGFESVAVTHVKSLHCHNVRNRSVSDWGGRLRLFFWKSWCQSSTKCSSTSPGAEMSNLTDLPSIARRVI